MEDSKLENVIRKLAIVVGLAMLLASIYLSYDGFDQTVSGDNPTYTGLAMAIGYTLAVGFTLAEFMVTSRNEGLNSTIKWLGILAYSYSIYTNYLGLQHLLQMDKGMAILTAVVMDVFPEQMIAWGLGEAVMHDLFGNLGKFATAPISPRKGGGGGGSQNHHNNNQNQQKPKGQEQRTQPRHQFQTQGHHNGLQRREELERGRGNHQERQFSSQVSTRDFDDEGD